MSAGRYAYSLERWKKRKTRTQRTRRTFVRLEKTPRVAANEEEVRRQREKGGTAKVLLEDSHRYAGVERQLTGRNSKGRRRPRKFPTAFTLTPPRLSSFRHRQFAVLFADVGYSACSSREKDE